MGLSGKRMNTKEATLKALEDLTREVRYSAAVACDGLASADACHEVVEGLVPKVDDLTIAVNSLAQSIGAFIDEVRHITSHQGDRLNQLEKRAPSADALQIKELMAAKEERL
jgi:uncharacterized protein YoxC